MGQHLDEYVRLLMVVTQHLTEQGFTFVRSEIKTYTGVEGQALVSVYRDQDNHHIDMVEHISSNGITVSYNGSLVAILVVGIHDDMLPEALKNLNSDYLESITYYNG